MRKIFVFSLLFIVMASLSQAKEISGVNMPDQYQIGKTVLTLNGGAARRKFIFVKIYVGALYVEKKSSDPKDILNQNLKVIRMHFTYHKVTAKEIRDAYRSDLKRVDPKINNSPAEKKFFALLNFDVKSTDNMDLIFTNNTLTVLYNLKKIGTVKSKQLTDDVLNIYIGKKPVQESLKEGLLGK